MRFDRITGRGWEEPDKGDFKVSLKPKDDYLLNHVNTYARRFEDYPDRDAATYWAKNASCSDFKVEYDKVLKGKDDNRYWKCKALVPDFNKYKPRDD